MDHPYRASADLRTNHRRRAKSNPRPTLKTQAGRDDRGAASRRRVGRERQNLMRKLSLFVLMSSAAPVAVAALPQGAVVGDSCRHAIQFETDSGRRPKYDVERMLQKNILLFEDTRESDKSIQTLYRCSASDGPVIGYSISVTASSEPVARSAYASAKAKMQAELGIAASDSETFGLPQRIRLWRTYSSAFSVNEFAQWSHDPSRGASVTIQKPRNLPTWRVVASDMPAPSSGGDMPLNQQLRLLAPALIVAVSSAAIVAALTLTRLFYFRWLIAIAVPLAVSFESYWTSPWNGTGSAGQLWWASFLTIGGGFVAGAIASSIVVWLLSRRLPQPPPTDERWKLKGKPLLLSGLGLFVALIIWTWWQFRPGNDPGNLAGNLDLRLALPPLALLLSTVLVLLGSVRLPSGLFPTVGRDQVADIALAVTGVLTSVVGITLCVNIAAEIALGLSSGFFAV
jgi:hypothetical protein